MVALEAQDDNVGKVRRLSVKDNYRRHGVGRLLIITLEEWAEKHGFRKVWLGTGAVMDKALAFYSSMDYTQTTTVVINESHMLKVSCLRRSWAMMRLLAVTFEETTVHVLPNKSDLHTHSLTSFETASFRIFLINRF